MELLYSWSGASKWVGAVLYLLEENIPFTYIIPNWRRSLKPFGVCSV